MVKKESGQGELTCPRIKPNLSHVVLTYVKKFLHIVINVMGALSVILTYIDYPVLSPAYASRRLIYSQLGSNVYISFLLFSIGTCTHFNFIPTLLPGMSIVVRGTRLPIIRIRYTYGIQVV